MCFNFVAMLLLNSDFYFYVRLLILLKIVTHFAFSVFPASKKKNDGMVVLCFGLGRRG